MAKFNQDVPQFGSAKPANTGGSQHCAECELMLADALDGTLSIEDQAKFDQHMTGCGSCSEMLADARRGAEWLELLRAPRPEPPAALIERIFAHTSGQDHLAPGSATHGNFTVLSSSVSVTPPLSATAGGVQVTRQSNVLPFRSRMASLFTVRGFGQSMLQPRLAMTAAMAFFSVGLTLNLTGVHLNELHASDLKPVNLRRSFYQANAHVVRYYDNLRVVYELESRVRDLQHASDNDAPALPESSDRQPEVPTNKTKDTPDGSQPQQKQSRPRPNSGSSRRQAFAGPTSLVASYPAEFPASPPRLSARRFTTRSSFRSIVQEGELV